MEPKETSIANHKAVTRFSLEIRPNIPETLRRLPDLANDLIYSWERPVRMLFYRLDKGLWQTCGHNPKLFLRRIAQEKLDAAARDLAYLQYYNRVVVDYDTYIDEQPKENKVLGLDRDTDLVAYFCAEFGFHESFPIYSGGLGILAADHCKAASDLGIPLTAVGLLYRQGYFTQAINREGKQIAHYPTTNFDELPISPVLNDKNETLLVHIRFPNRKVYIKVWQARAGHTHIYLLDTDIEQNTEKDRQITHRLYGGDKKTRLEQEMVLGMGGVRALTALNIKPSVWHINEGHAAFLIPERCLELVKKDYPFDTALEIVSANSVFTTHTPVPAGHDFFEHELLLKYFKHYIKALQIDEDTFTKLGLNQGADNEFNMTAFALRCSCYHNGVSKIHGAVASNMESHIWPDIPEDENPIDYITNGIHVPTFLAGEWSNLFNMQFGGEWRSQLLNKNFWQQIDDIPDYNFWGIKRSLKSELLEYLKHHLNVQLVKSQHSATRIERITHHLNTEQDILIIGFARRFATYKRANLIFSDLDRLARLMDDPERPVIIVYAGKAHPKDEAGQELLQKIYQYSLEDRFEGKVLMVENYNLALAREMLAGVDVWLNTPEHPQEASGTSGMKAGINGVINLSILDGWWDEGYDGENGWGIAPHDVPLNIEENTFIDAEELLDILEYKVIPLYFEKNGQSYSKAWVKKAKSSMKSIIPAFNAQRMIKDYAKKLYVKANQRYHKLQSDNYQQASQLAQWKKNIEAHWPDVELTLLEQPEDFINTGELFSIRVNTTLGKLSTDDVIVECVFGHDDNKGNFIKQNCLELEVVGQNKNNEVQFELSTAPELTGLQSYKIRIYPYHPLLSRRFETGLMKWL